MLDEHKDQLERAQRRPEPKPGDTRQCGSATARRFASLNEGRSRNPGDTCSCPVFTCGSHLERSTKAGAETPATLQDALETIDGFSHAQRRPGAETPATPEHPKVACSTIGSLNEGRSRNPGDTPNCPIKRYQHENWHAGTRFPGLTSAHARPKAPQRALSRA